MGSGLLYTSVEASLRVECIFPHPKKSYFARLLLPDSPIQSGHWPCFVGILGTVVQEHWLCTISASKKYCWIPWIATASIPAVAQNLGWAASFWVETSIELTLFMQNEHHRATMEISYVPLRRPICSDFDSDETEDKQQLLHTYFIDSNYFVKHGNVMPQRHAVFF